MASQRGLATLLLADPQPDWRVHAPRGEFSECDIRHIPFALGKEIETRTLHVTAAPGCSSCLQPNEELLSLFPVREWFKVSRIEKIDIRAFSDLAQEMNLPSPDIVKVDVQGMELEVLSGLGPMLAQVTCVEVEVNFEQLYTGQPVLSDVYRFMRERGFGLRDLQPQGVFEGQSIEFNSYWSSLCQTPRQGAIERFWRRAHGVWPGEYFADIDGTSRRVVRFNQA
jgi:FkbM family methyltransferase